MSTISVADLKKKSAEDLLKSTGKDNLIITADGHPVALLLDIKGVSAGSTDSLLRSITALKAQAFLQDASAKNGAANLAMDDIDAEIAAVRHTARSQRNA